ncbi:hypothetical protein J8273_5175 [Carpediemonas membranifera]|uniref:Uncharacterized protein n=1 Tax=Carpediemonas membranifera TaxID=201153 RepID=A0A8J6AZH6_9EUKA|nr:hypothetical protein J8273_5175 [Carpediemonas membranifera]|eukprot:KAG9392193.1 hypothetical protein J8273_5175 [Carpediemonas membranifera]
MPGPTFRGSTIIPLPFIIPEQNYWRNKDQPLYTPKKLVLGRDHEGPRSQHPASPFHQLPRLKESPYARISPSPPRFSPFAGQKETPSPSSSPTSPIFDEQEPTPQPSPSPIIQRQPSPSIAPWRTTPPPPSRSASPSPSVASSLDGSSSPPAPAGPAPQPTEPSRSAEPRVHAPLHPTRSWSASPKPASPSPINIPVNEANDRRSVELDDTRAKVPLSPTRYNLWGDPTLIEVENARAPALAAIPTSSTLTPAVIECVPSPQPAATATPGLDARSQYVDLVRKTPVTRALSRNRRGPDPVTLGLDGRVEVLAKPVAGDNWDNAAQSRVEQVGPLETRAGAENMLPSRVNVSCVEAARPGPAACLTGSVETLPRQNPRQSWPRAPLTPRVENDPPSLIISTPVRVEQFMEAESDEVELLEPADAIGAEYDAAEGNTDAESIPDVDMTVELEEDDTAPIDDDSQSMVDEEASAPSELVEQAVTTTPILADHAIPQRTPQLYTTPTQTHAVKTTSATQTHRPARADDILKYIPLSSSVVQGPLVSVELQRIPTTPELSTATGGTMTVAADDLGRALTPWSLSASTSVVQRAGSGSILIRPTTPGIAGSYTPQPRRTLSEIRLGLRSPGHARVRSGFVFPASGRSGPSGVFR